MKKLMLLFTMCIVLIVGGQVTEAKNKQEKVIDFTEDRAKSLKTNIKKKPVIDCDMTVRFYSQKENDELEMSADMKTTYDLKNKSGIIKVSMNILGEILEETTYYKEGKAYIKEGDEFTRSEASIDIDTTFDPEMYIKGFKEMKGKKLANGKEVFSAEVTDNTSARTKVEVTFKGSGKSYSYDKIKMTYTQEGEGVDNKLIVEIIAKNIKFSNKKVKLPNID